MSIMRLFWSRPVEEKDLIRKAYDAEVTYIEINSADTNPYYDKIMALPDGADIWDAINFALELRYHGGE